MEIIIQCERVTTDYTAIRISQSELHKMLKDGSSLNDIVDELVYNKDYSSFMEEPPMEGESWKIIGVEGGRK